MRTLRSEYRPGAAGNLLALSAVLLAACASPSVERETLSSGELEGMNEVIESQEQDLQTVEEWTTFRGSVRRLGHAGDPPRLGEPRELWRFDTGGTVESTPTLWRDLILVGTFAEHLFALDAATGEERWRFQTGGLVRASPSVAHGVVYFGADDDLFYALDAASGEERWRFSLGPGGEQSSPAIVDGVVYFGAFDHTVYALDATSGEERWRYATGGGILSSPAVANGILVIGSVDGGVHAVDIATGERRWLFPASEEPIFASPTIVGDLVVIGSYDSSLYALALADGTPRWTFAVGGKVFSTAAESGGRLYFGADNGLHALEAGTGETLWHRPLGGRILASPALLESAGALIVGSSESGVLTYSLDGELLATLPITDKVWSSTTVAPDGTLYFGAHDGFVYAFGAGS